MPSLLLLAFCAPGGAMAQASQAGAGRLDTMLEEIIVTARKREESLQDAPISISAFTGDQLELRGISDIDQLQNISPNLTFIDSSTFIAGSNSATVFLRGIGQADFAPTTEPGVGIYVDGVYFGRTVGSVLNTTDFERVEVLRGPQGTLFGRNTIGGAVSITSVKPHEEFEAKAEATVGTDDRIDAKGMVNGRIAHNLFGRLTLATYNQDGYLEHATTGQDFGDEDEIAGRAALRWLPIEDVEINVAFDYSSDRENGRAARMGGVVFISPFGPDGMPGTPDDTVPNFPFINNVFNGVNGAGINGCDGTFANPAGSLDNPDCTNDQYLNQIAGEGPYFSNVDTYGISGTVDWSINEWLAIKSITSYRRVHAHANRDNDNTPTFITSEIEDIFKQKQFTQEVQVLGNAFAGKLEWILGFFYFHEYGINPNPVTFLPTTLISGGDFDNDSIAGFGQGTYHITDHLHLTAGIRYTDDTKSFFPQQVVLEDRTGGPPFIFGPGVRPLPFVKKTIKADDWTPAVSLAYDWTEDLMTYVSYSEGFKGGGFEQRVFPPIVPGITCPSIEPLDCIPTFDPETVKVYEGGFKFSGMNGRLRLNGAGFYTDYDDLQITVLTGIAPVLNNAGTATIAGFELEGQWVPVDTWFVEAAAGYTDASYDTLLPGAVTTGVQLDNELAWVPEWTLSGSLLKEFTLANDMGSLVPRIDWSYRSKTWYDAVNTLDSFQEGFHLVHGSVSWESVDGHYGLIVGVKNIGDEEYSQLRRIQIPFGTFEDLLARDREWYLTVKVQY
jgi:iron complex outermembrane receptor protein